MFEVINHGGYSFAGTASVNMMALKSSREQIRRKHSTLHKFTKYFLKKRKVMMEQTSMLLQIIAILGVSSMKFFSNLLQDQEGGCTFTAHQDGRLETIPKLEEH